MKAPKIQAPVESESDKATRAAAEKQAESDRIAETQGLLSSGTIRRQRRFGVASRGQPQIFGRLFGAPGGNNRSLAAGGAALGGGTGGPAISFDSGALSREFPFLEGNYYY